MAVLKDLIVHGASRFINLAQYTAAKGNTIAADEGIFNKLVATKADIADLDVTNLTAQNAKVMGLLDVQGELHTNKWTNANIANIGGSFYISPTVSTAINSNGTPMTVTITGTSGSRTIAVSGGNFVTDAVKIYSNSATTTASWAIGSHVMITGSVCLEGGVDYPLGTCSGYLEAPLTTGGFTLEEVNSAALESIISELGTSLKSYELSISMFEIGPRASIKPVGIMMTSYGVDKSTYIDIYGGVNRKGGAKYFPTADTEIVSGKTYYIYVDGTGYTQVAQPTISNIKNYYETSSQLNNYTTPNVRIGYLGGIPQYKDSADNIHKPTGWGIYTDNGYFKGVVVADSGLIGGWTIDSNSIHSSDKNVWDKDEDGIFIGNYIDESYFLTEDTEWNSEKTYYEYNSQTRIYSEVQNQVSNPKQSSYYEKESQSIFTISGGKIQYIETEDIEVNPNSEYYSYDESDDTYTKIISPSGNPKDQGWFISLGPMWYINSDGSASFGSLLVNQTGKLDVPAASITGKLTADQIEVTDLSAISAQIGSTITSETTTNSLEVNSGKKVIDSLDTRQVDKKEYQLQNLPSSVNELNTYHSGEEYLLKTKLIDISYVLNQEPVVLSSLTATIRCWTNRQEPEDFTKSFTCGTAEEFIIPDTNNLVSVVYDGSMTFTLNDGFDGLQLTNVTYTANTTTSINKEIVEESFVKITTEKKVYILTTDTEVKEGKEYYFFDPLYLLTEDEMVKENKYYYTQIINNDGTYTYPKVVNPASNPKENEYYELHPKYEIVSSEELINSVNPTEEDWYEIDDSYSGGIDVQEGTVSILSNNEVVASTGGSDTSLNIYTANILDMIKIGVFEVTSVNGELVVRLGD